MKVSEQFKSTIKAYLDNMAAVDSLFAPVYQKPTKNIDNCITYILNQVKKSGCCGAVVLVMMKFLVWRCTIIRKIILRWVAH